MFCTPVAWPHYGFAQLEPGACYAQPPACHAAEARLLSGGDAEALAAHARLLQSTLRSLAAPHAPPGLAPEEIGDELSEKAASCDSGSTCAPEDTSGEAEGAATTLMIRNLPNRYSQSKLIEELNLLGLDGCFDFVYVPLASATLVNVGYSFVNFTEPRHAVHCMKLMDGRRFSQQRRDKKVARVSVARVQGLEANLRHYERAASKSMMAKQRKPFIAAARAQECS